MKAGFCISEIEVLKLSEQGDSFTRNILAISNRIREANGLPESDDVNNAAVLLLTHIITSVLPVEGLIEESKAVVSAIFLYFVGTQLVLHARNEGIEIPINETIVKASIAAFQYLDPDRAMKIIHSGMEQYKATIKAANTTENIREYTEALSEIIWTYVTSRDERFLEAFRSLYMTIYNAQDR